MRSSRAQPFFSLQDDVSAARLRPLPTRLPKSNPFLSFSFRRRIPQHIEDWKCLNLPQIENSREKRVSGHRHFGCHRLCVCADARNRAQHHWNAVADLDDRDHHDDNNHHHHHCNGASCGRSRAYRLTHHQGDALSPARWLDQSGFRRKRSHAWWLGRSQGRGQED